MSNHAGSYMINDILYILDEYKVFDVLGKQKTLDLLNKIRKVGIENDCNDGEILDEIGEKLKIVPIAKTLRTKAK